MIKPSLKEDFSLADTMPDPALSVDDFAYELPADLIAQQPLPFRHQSRLLKVDKTSSSISHHKFEDLTSLLQPGNLVVVNDTRVIPARLHARRATGGKVELLLLAPQGSPALWQAMASPLRKLSPGDVLQVETVKGSWRPIAVKEIVIGPDGQRRLLIDLGNPEQVYSFLSEAGFAPLPPYIHRDSNLVDRPEDLERYQTVYARAPGAVAAPTAGLHFTDELMHALSGRGIQFCSITLHVGPGTFKPITSSLDQHVIERETFAVPAETALAVNSALQEGRRVIAVGTTTCRALETAGAGGRLQAMEGPQTDLYIRPGFPFKIISGLITNFHLSRSSLLVLVCAFGGHELVLKAYRQAVVERYRFYSYGDAMLIL